MIPQHFAGPFFPLAGLTILAILILLIILMVVGDLHDD